MADPAPDPLWTNGTDRSVRLLSAEDTPDSGRDVFAENTSEGTTGGLAERDFDFFTSKNAST